jgi:diadenosine tetraphosphatase ApaH/serine/threonine PP2A family protein phosphatase
MSLRRDPARLILTGEYLIVGDLHGDLVSLLRIFGRFGFPPSRSYLVLGDYVDRGPCSCGVVLLLFALKLLYPKQVYLLRGNHEFRAQADINGLRDECIRCFSHDVYESILSCFSELSLCAVVNARVFCVHGGIPQHAEDLLGLSKSDEPGEVIDDLLWSDPVCDVIGFQESYRGKGHLFGAKEVANFLDQTGMLFVIRAHQMCREGYDYPFDEEGGLMTVFSSCNYCGQRNDAGVVIVGERKMEAHYIEPMKNKKKEVYQVLWPEWIIGQCHMPPMDCLGELGEEQLVEMTVA